MKLALSWLLFTAESMGALIILWNGVPIHQRLLTGRTAQEAGPRVFVLGVVAVILVQSAYWIRLRCFPPLRFKRQLVLGHAIQFLGRLSFVFIGGMFSVVFFAHFEELEFSIWKALGASPRAIQSCSQKSFGRISGRCRSFYYCWS